MPQGRFTKQEAENLVGKHIRTRVQFSGVPEGAKGRVVKSDYIGLGRDDNENIEGMYDVVIEWNLPNRQFRTQQRPLQDWFNKDEFERYLEEL
jgi:hypothetical protein